MNWDSAYSRGRDYSWFSTADLSELLESVGLTGGSSLDIGCGTGQLVRDLHHRGFRSIGVDTSEKAIEIANDSTVFSDSIRFAVRDIAEEPLGEKFDLITCKYVMAFVPDRLKFIQSVVEMMNSGESYFVVITPNPETIPDSKRSIAVDTDELKIDLSEHFGGVRVVVRGSDIWLICKL